MRSMLLCLLLATVTWLPLVHYGFTPDRPAVAAALAKHQMSSWGEPDRAPLRATNPEWELMRRTFDVLAFAERAHGFDRAALGARHTIDVILDQTLAEEARHGQRWFLLPYARERPFRDRAGRSLFVDGELLLMLETRLSLGPSPRYAAEAEKRARLVAAQLERAPLTLAESYPDEGWTFCNVVALRALRLHDAATGQDHRPLVAAWLRSARAHLVDPRTGLLASSFDYDGRIEDGPEGSTIWLVAAFLRPLDPAFAEDQYRRARHELVGATLGFAWAREWPASWAGHDDIDSGPTVPIVGANAGSSGMALVAARAFGDEALLTPLLTSLELAGFPENTHDGGRRYLAGNDLADAVVLYALGQGAP